MSYALTAATAAVGTGALRGARDFELAEALRGRHPDALAEAFRRHATTAAGVAFNILHRHGAADDIVQQVFHGLWARPERFDPNRGALKTFVRVDARGRSLDLLRSETSRRSRELATYEPPASIVDPASIIAARSTATAVNRALETLPGVEREAIAMAFFAGCSYREVALQLGIPEGTVKGRIRTGLRRLRVTLDPIRPDSVIGDRSATRDLRPE